MNEPQPQNQSGLVSPSGSPFRRDGKCPRCGAEKSKRVALAAFGRPPHDVCVECGFEFEESTC